ncbi:MAG: hypothetical protein EAX95_13170 [Candidatus Thorarchaeota archaeon]|nr:hypothetical protein [Candidatus Thorarchaeota archaeon]
MLDRWLHLFACFMLVLNMGLILYAVVSITTRMTLSGVALLDSLPVGLYILPLMVILPLLVKAYYNERFAPFNFVVLLISSFIFGILSVLVRAFILFSTLNIVALAIIFVMGRFRPNVNLRKVRPKAIAIVLLFNMLGFMFPITTIAMGVYPIARDPARIPDSIALSVPLADFSFPYVNLTPTPDMLLELEQQNYSLDFRVLEGDTDSLQRLRNWLTQINSTSIEYSITMTSPRDSFLPGNSTIGTDSILEAIYASHTAGFGLIVDELESLNVARLPKNILYDMTLSDTEWRSLMDATRRIDLVGFGTLIRNLIDSTDPAVMDSAAWSLANFTREAGFMCGVLVEPFVIDDLQDADSLSMRACGITVNGLAYWDIVEVSCSRSSFSLEMNGDVGEYLVHSYSRSLLSGGVALSLRPNWSMRLGTVGNVSDSLGRLNDFYGTLGSIAYDIAAAGGAVERVTVESLPAMLLGYGEDALTSLRQELAPLQSVPITYTFRIYAFRAVFIVIDSFDPLML